MAGLIGALVLIAIAFWLLGRPRRRAPPAPEDDVGTPLDEGELAEAERELADNPGARPIGDEDEDDWGPGTR